MVLNALAGSVVPGAELLPRRAQGAENWTAGEPTAGRLGCSPRAVPTKAAAARSGLIGQAVRQDDCVQGSRRMRLADAAWLGIDRPHNRALVVAVLQLSGELDLDALRARVQERMVDPYPRFRQRVHPSMPSPRWGMLTARWQHDRTFDLGQHVVGPLCDHPCDDKALQRLAGTLLGQPLDPERPPWQMHLVRLHGGGSALVARFHHGLADGIALASVLLRLADDVAYTDPPGVRPESTQQGGRTGDKGAGVLRAAWTGARVSLSVLPTLLNLVLRMGEPPTLLRGPLGTAKSLAWTRPNDLKEVRAVARAHGASINDVLLAATAAGLRRHLQERGGTVGDLRAAVPVDLRRGTPVPADLGNTFGVVFVPLPVGEADPLRRLQLVARSTRRLKGSAQAGVTFTLLRIVGTMPKLVRELAVAVLGESASAVVTNVPGPRETLHIDGHRLDEVVFWGPQAGRISLGVSLFSYAGAVTVGVAVDSGLGIDPEGLAQQIQDELGVLRGLAEPPAAQAR